MGDPTKCTHNERAKALKLLLLYYFLENVKKNLFTLLQCEVLRDHSVQAHTLQWHHKRHLNQ